MNEPLPEIGFGLPVSGSWATPDVMVHVARRAELLGYSSLWAFHRVLFPVEVEEAGAAPSTRRTDAPFYRSVHDPLVSLAFVAGQTERIRLGTATICAPFTSPALLAKTINTLDILSGGRLTIGLGLGWMPQEFAAAGVPMERRGARMDEYLRCLEALWTDDPVEFAGEFYTVPRSRMQPAPVQRPHPPVLLGGTAEAALGRAGRLAQGWISSSRQDLTSIASSVEIVREAARAAGRDPEALRIVVRGVVELTDEELGPERLPLHGTREQIVGDLVSLRSQGVSEVFLDLNFLPRVGSPDVDAGESLALADRVLETFAPAALSA